MPTAPSSEARQPKIYISYRRNDSAGYAGRLSDRLSQTFGPENIFMDVDRIAPGRDLGAAISQEIEFVDVVLVLIGPQWLTPGGQFARRELELALNLGKPLIPVLVDGAQMPPTRELPGSLQSLALRHAVKLEHPTFSRDVDVLIAGIRRLTETKASEIELTENAPVSVFVSHSTSDRHWVEREIVEFLKANRINPWYSAHSISSATQWEREILKGMQSCEWFSLVISPSAAESDWVKDELFWAMQNRPTKIVPIMMTRCDLYQFHIRLPRIQHVDFTESKTVARQKLLALFKDQAVN